MIEFRGGGFKRGSHHRAQNSAQDRAAAARVQRREMDSGELSCCLRL
jgi:hypothetical protein